MIKQFLRRLRRLWRLANPDIVQVMCPTCNDLVDAYERHDCPHAVIDAVIVIDIGEMPGRHIFKR